MMLPLCAAAQTPSFSDVTSAHPAFDAVEYLKQHGVLQGYEDGTFRPEQAVNRAEALKTIVSTVATDAQLKVAQGESVFDDVASDAWYLPFVEHARKVLRIIDGPPKKTAFKAADPVKRAEFLKMLLLARKIDAANIFGDLRGPLAPDVTSANDWYYPYMRYALAASMVSADAGGRLSPAGGLTRGDIAVILYRLEMFRQNRRTQALLGRVDQEIERTLKFLQDKQSNDALFAANRLVIFARGALLDKSDDDTVKANVKIAEAVQLVVLAYQAGEARKLADVASISSDAWHLAEKAKGYDIATVGMANQIQEIAKHMADEARELQKRG